MLVFVVVVKIHFRFVVRTSQELRMLTSVTLYCQLTLIVMTWGSHLSLCSQNSTGRNRQECQTIFLLKKINLFDKLSKFVNIVNNVNQKYISVSSKIVDTLPRLPKLWTNVRNVSILSTDLFSFFKNCQNKFYVYLATWARRTTSTLGSSDQRPHRP